MRNGEWSKLLSVTSRILLAFLFVFAQSVRAGQDSKAKDKAKPAQKAAVQQTTEKPSPTATTAKTRTEKAEAAENSSAEEKPAGDGKHEGIKVHGHWTIEVLNPDGTLVKHVEFENSLTGGQQPTSLMVGASVPGGFKVLLADSASNGSGPCPAGANNVTSCFLVGSLTNPTPAGFHDQASGCPGAADCYPLNISANSAGTSVSLVGTATAVSNGQITDVSTFILVCGNQYSPQTCAATTTETLYGFTHVTLSSPISVSAGQSMAVNVVISFS